MNRKSRGFSAPEFLVLVAVGTLLVSSVAARVLHLGRSQVDLPPADSVHVMLQLARVEAAARRVPCRFLFDPETRGLEVLDTRGTEGRADDRSLYRTRLAEGVALKREERWKPLPKDLSRHPFEIIFLPSGRVSAGAGKIVVASDFGLETLSVFENGELSVVADAAALRPAG